MCLKQAARLQALDIKHSQAREACKAAIAGDVLRAQMSSGPHLDGDVHVILHLSQVHHTVGALAQLDQAAVRLGNELCSEEGVWGRSVKGTAA